MEYPVRFNVCPCCSSPRRFVEEETQAEIKAGKLEEGMKVPAFITKSMLFDPNSKTAILARKQVTVLVGICDICCNCGAVYCTEMHKQYAIADPQVQQPKK